MRGRRPPAGDPARLPADRAPGALSPGDPQAGDPRTGDPAEAVDPQAGLYLHVPFCSAVCPYCDFAVTVGGETSRRRYLTALLSEVDLWAEDAANGSGAAPDGRWWLPFDTVYLGGGTPSWLREDELAAILDRLDARFATAGAWTQLEANPEDVSAAALAAWRRLGVRVVSLGVQSFAPEALAFLGRRHDAEAGRAAVAAALAAGFDVVSLDLIYGLPGQTVEDWRRDLDAALALAPQHLSCYQLTVEAGTVFGRRKRRGELAELPEERQAELFRFTHAYLADAGYPAYEVSNFARAPEHRSRHNRKYWRQAPYLGLGPSAHSFDGVRRRWWNEASLAAWRARVGRGERPVASGEALSATERAFEELMLGLRTAEGIDLFAFRRRHGVDLMDSDGALILELVAGGRALIAGGRLRLTLEGLVVAEALTACFDLGG